MATPILPSGGKTRNKRGEWKVTGTKTCCGCGITKPVSAFYVYKSGERRGSPWSRCKDCESKRTKARNPRKTPIRFESETQRECRRCGKIKNKAADFYKTSKGSGVGGYTIYCKECQLAATERSRAKANGAWSRNYARKVKASPKLRLKYRALYLIRASLIGKFKYSKRGSVTSGFWEAVGYTQDELFQHIEAQFYGHMSWANMSQWHIDHIVPVSAFEFDSMEDDGFKACWALSNLRPLWAKKNESKGSKRLFLI